MKKQIFLVIFFLLLASCSNKESDKVRQLESSLENSTKKIEELESIIEEQDHIIAQQSEEIESLAKINKLNQEIIRQQVSQNNQEEDTEAPTLKLGETFSNDEIEVTLHKVEKATDGLQVYFDVHNKSEEPLENPGVLKFKLDKSEYEDEFNRQGYGMHFEESGWIYKDEERSGYYSYHYNRDVEIEEIHYYHSISGYATDLTAKWILE